MASICALIVSEWSIPTTDDTSSNVVDSNFSAASIWYCSWLYLSALKKSASSNDLLAAAFGSDPLDDFALDPINLVQIHSKRGKYAANYFAFIKGCVESPLFCLEQSVLQYVCMIYLCLFQFIAHCLRLRLIRASCIWYVQLRHKDAVW